jgi:glycosyltransferase involved in cell wall biosynthesis
VRINVLFGRELLSRGHEIDLVMQAAAESVTLGAQPWHGRTVWVGPTDTADTLFHRMRRLWLALRHDLRFLMLAKRTRYDAVLVSDKFFLSAIALILAHSRRMKFFFWLTFPYPEAEAATAKVGIALYPKLARLRAWVSRWLLYEWVLPRSDFVFVQSEQMKADVRAHGIDPSQVMPIVSGFDPQTIIPSAEHTKCRLGKQKSFTIGYLGTLSAARHLEVLVEMLAQLRNRGMSAHLLLVGDAHRRRDRSLLERRASELGMAGYMEITGFLPQPEALARVQQADVCLSPFYPSPILLSTSPTKLVEYLALARPVIANDHPEQRLILRESRAGLCVPWGARYFARAVRWLMERSHEERAAMGARGRQWVEKNRSYARIADDIERAVSNLLTSAR